jgi:hypothetical protein
MVENHRASIYMGFPLWEYLNQEYQTSLMLLQSMRQLTSVQIAA